MSLTAVQSALALDSLGPARPRFWNASPAVVKPSSFRLLRFLPLLEKYSEYMANECSLALNTQKINRHCVTRFLWYLQHVRNLNIGPENVDRQLAVDYLVWLKDSCMLSASTRSGLAIGIRQFYQWLYREGHVRIHVLESLRSPKIPLHFPRPVPPQQLARLLAQPDRGTFHGRRDLAILEILYGSGLRIGEAMRLRFENLNLDDDLNGANLSFIGKGEKPRMVPFSDAGLEALKSYLELRGKGRPWEYVFIAERTGQPIVHHIVRKNLRRYLERARLSPDITPHRLRHSFASHLLANGATIEVIGMLLGHNQLRSTQIYAQVTPTQSFAAYKKANIRGRLKAASRIP